MTESGTGLSDPNSLTGVPRKMLDHMERGALHVGGETLDGQRLG